MKVHIQRPKLPRGIHLRVPYHCSMIQGGVHKIIGFFLAYSPHRVKLQKETAKGELVPSELKRYKN